MAQKTMNPTETEAQTDSPKNEQPRRLGLKIRSRVRAGATALDGIDGGEPTTTTPCTWRDC